MKSKFKNLVYLIIATCLLFLVAPISAVIVEKSSASDEVVSLFDVLTGYSYGNYLADNINNKDLASEEIVVKATDYNEDNSYGVTKTNGVLETTSGSNVEYEIQAEKAAWSLCG